MLEWSQQTLEDGVEPLWRRGIRGKNITVALIDSGIDGIGRERLEWETDLTGEGLQDDLGHGTSMAGFILDYAPEASLVSIKVLGSRGRLRRERLVSALQLARDNAPPIKLLNLSLQIRQPFLPWERCRINKPCIACAKLQTLIDDGFMAVVAAGNQGPRFDTLTCPARNASALTVTALRNRGKLHPQFKANTGTSVSAALVSGGVALLLDADPSLDLSAVREGIAATATRLLRSDPSGSGSGQAHFYRASKYLAHVRAGRAIDPKRAQGLYRRSLIELETENLKASRDLLLEAVSLAPTSSTLESQLGYVAFKMSDIQATLEHLQEAVDLNWLDVKAHTRLADVLRQLGLEKEAKLHDQAALSYR